MKYMKLGSKPDAFQADGNNIRFVATELATDIVVNVGDVKFFLHKFPLLSKSSLLKRLVSAMNDDYGGGGDEIHIPDIPGGPSSFEICAKFCYGMIVTLNAYNVVAARCAAEYLEMHEGVEKGNLIYKIEVFLNSSIFRSWKDSIIVLQTTRSLLPWSEDLKLVNQCVDSIASRASIDPSQVEWSYTYNRNKVLSENSLDPHWNGVRKQQMVPKDWWVEDLCELEVESYKRVLMAIKTKGNVDGEVVEEALKAYACRRIPGFAKGYFASLAGDWVKVCALVETIIWLLPEGRGSVSCGFLLKLLSAAISLRCSETVKTELVKRIGRQLEDASVRELLIPAVMEGVRYDVEVVVSLVEEFLMQQEKKSADTSLQISQELRQVGSPPGSSSSSTSTAKLAVGRLVDEYLMEIAKDLKLPLSKFVELAEMVSGPSRPVHDALYHAIDMYLKEHSELSKTEKKKLCGLVDCRRLSVDASMHAVQNDRLPVRMVVQVLYFEQIRASAAITGGVSELQGSVRSSLPGENCGGSYGSSRSGVTTNAEEWDPVGSFQSMKPDEDGGGRAKPVKSSRNILSKILSGKGHVGENSSSSDASESPPVHGQPDSTKHSTPSRSNRRSVS